MLNRFNGGLWISLILVLFSCKKAIPDGEQPVEDEGYLMVSGTLFNQQTQRYEPFYWKDKDVNSLHFSGASAGAAGILSVGRDIYIAGYYVPSNSSNDYLPCYWKNGVEVKLPVDAIKGSFAGCMARDFAYWNGDLYIVGSVDSNPVLWILKKDGAIETITPEGEPETLYGGCRNGGNVAVHKGQLYIPGDQIRQEGNGFRFQVGYWQMDLSTKKITWKALEQHLVQARVFSMALTNEDVYLTGEKTVGAGAPIPAFWGPGGPVLLDVPHLNNLRMGQVVSDSSGVLHLMVNDYSSFQPQIWKLKPGAQLQIDTLSFPAGYQAICSHRVQGSSQIIYVGRWLREGVHHIYREQNGQRVELELPYRLVQPTISDAEWIPTK